MEQSHRNAGLNELGTRDSVSGGRNGSKWYWPYPHPNPSPEGRGACFVSGSEQTSVPSPFGEGGASLQMAMRAGCMAGSAGEADCKFRPRLSLFEVAVFRRTLTPTPPPEGEGLRFSLALGLSDPVPTCPLFRIPNLESQIPIPRPQITRNVIAFNTARVRSRVPSFSRMVET
ncbi:hypothetical protein IB62_009740 [Xanthomonas euvesicatoria]|nr:hypothetical protein IB62_009740 [Xanthomonas euvesicatoria]